MPNWSLMSEPQGSHWHLLLVPCMFVPPTPLPPFPRANCVGICLPCQITFPSEARDHAFSMFEFSTVPAIPQAGINKGLLNK